MKLLTQHPHWSQAQEIAERLRRAGYRAVLAGGCVRDAVLNIMPADLDIATDATPEDIEQLFTKVIPVGKSFGVCRVVMDGAALELATFREESDYQDGRHPQQVQYSTLEKDVLRRDFTMNALFYDIAQDKVIDLVDGIKDIKSKLIRAVGVPEQRFAEDHLRILRGLRFAAQLNFRIDEGTLKALTLMVPGLEKISRERIQDELHKVFQSTYPWIFMKLAKKVGALESIFKNWQWDFSGDFAKYGVRGWHSWFHLEKKMTKNFRDLSEAWANLGLHYLRQSLLDKKDYGVAMAELKQFLKEMKLSVETIDHAIEYLDHGPLFSQKLTFEQMLEVASHRRFSLIEEFWRKEWLALKGNYPFKNIWQEFKNQYMVSGQLPEPLLKGQNLIEQGFVPGPNFKVVLKQAYEMQVRQKIKSQDELISKIKLG